MTKEGLFMKKMAAVLTVGLAMAAVGVRAQAPELKVGDAAPAFSLPGTDGKTHTLAENKGRMTVLAWFPKAFTGGCTAECKAFTSSGETIKKFDVAYYMASVDNLETQNKFAAQEQANFPMLADESQAAAKAYGVVPATGGLAKRWTFYIGPDGKILYIDKAVNTQTAGADLAARLEALGAKKK
jgi:peroxiredoxin Q/BCP